MKFTHEAIVGIMFNGNYTFVLDFVVIPDNSIIYLFFAGFTCRISDLYVYLMIL